MNTEPARYIGAIMAFLTLLVSFGVQITVEQQDAIKAFVEALFNAGAVQVTAEVIRRYVFAPASVGREL